MHATFEALAAGLFPQLHPNERLLLHARGEHSDYVRYNRAKVRQAGTIEHLRVSIRLLVGRRHATVSLDLGGNASDLARATKGLEHLRAVVPLLPEDPHLQLPDTVESTHDLQPSNLPDASTLSSQVLEAVGDADFVGILKVGPIFRAFADSTGQRNSFERSSFQLDSSLYAHTDKAEKVDIAGMAFDAELLAARMASAKARLPLLHREEKVLTPGHYRAYLAPSAVAELFGLVSRDGFSEAATRRGYSPIPEVHKGNATLSPHLHIVEATQSGLGPTFDQWGFHKPASLKLIDAGAAANRLVCPATAVEFDLKTTGANAYEMAETVHIRPGNLPEKEVLSALGTGLYVSNLHYLNYVESGGRITGLTRFASHWVEDGELVGPLKVMRFDDTVQRMMGSELEAFTDTVELVPEAYDYGGRMTNSIQTPGAMLSSLHLAL